MQIRVDAGDLANALECVIPHAAPNEKVLVLSTVQLRVSAAELELAATDRYTLATTAIPVALPSIVEDGTVLVSRRDALRLVRELKQAPGKATIKTWRTATRDADEAERVEVNVDSNGRDFGWGLQSVVGTFPDFEQLFAGHAPGRVRELEVDAARMARFVKSAKGSRMRLSLDENRRRPTLITIPGSPFRGLLTS